MTNPLPPLSRFFTAPLLNVLPTSICAIVAFNMFCSAFQEKKSEDRSGSVGGGCLYSILTFPLLPKGPLIGCAFFMAYASYQHLFLSEEMKKQYYVVQAFDMACTKIKEMVKKIASIARGAFEYIYGCLPQRPIWYLVAALLVATVVYRRSEILKFCEQLFSTYLVSSHRWMPLAT